MLGFWRVLLVVGAVELASDGGGLVLFGLALESRAWCFYCGKLRLLEASNFDWVLAWLISQLVKLRLLGVTFLFSILFAWFLVAGM